MASTLSIGPEQQRIEGRTVRDIVEHDPAQVNEVWCRKIFRQLLQSLELQHAMHMPHRAITPDTVVFHDNGEPLLLPSGDADVEQDEAADLTALARVYLSKVTGMTRTDLDNFLPADGKGKGIPKDRLATYPRDAEERRLEEGKVSEDALKWYIGKKAIGRQGCYACHDIPGFENAKPIGVGLNEWGKKDPERLAFEDIKNFVNKHYHVVDKLMIVAKIR